jgi:hypothetical protein
MLVTLTGIVTLVKVPLPLNALSPMEVTVPLTPGIDEGIVMAHGKPLYATMVRLVPLWV